MFNAFRRNLNNFFIINKDVDDYRMKTAEVLKGLSDILLYKKWKNEDIHRYKEINNLVYQINMNINEYPLFETFARIYGDMDMMQFKIVHLNWRR